MHLDTFITSALMVLIATSIAVALFKHFGLGSILGLLVAGIAVGPHSGGPYVTAHVEDVRHFTELGVVLLLFLIGLEMKPARLWSMRREVFGLGALQILLSGVVIGGYFLLYQNAWQAALLIGFTFALSSTAMVLQLLQEKGEIAAKHGTTAFSILLMQDLAIVPLLALVPILADTGTLSAGVPLWQQVVVVCGMLAMLFIFGRYLLPRALDHLSSKGNKEGFLLVVMLAVFFAAWAMHYAELSMALGTFIMGMLLSGSRYRLQVQASVEPYKGLLMSLFFVAVGMSIDLQALAEAPLLFLQHIAVIIALKFLVLLLLLLGFGYGRHLALRVALLLAQGGEFGFVLFGAAKALQVIEDTTFVTAVGVISVSMLLTPLLERLGERLAAGAQPVQPPGGGHPLPAPASSRPRVMIGGYGRVGRAVARMLVSSEIPFIAFDTNPVHVARGQEEGFPVYYGDVGDPDLLAAAHIHEAALVVLTIDHGPSALRAVAHIRSSVPRVPIIARARDLKACERLLEAGASRVMPETLESSLRLGAQVLEMIDIPQEDVESLLQDIREGDYSLMVQDAKTGS